MADKAAKDAITNPSATSVQLVTNQDVIPIIKLHCTNMWQSNWNSVCTKLHEIKQDAFIWSHPTDLPRKFEVILTRLRIGHTQITHSHLMIKNDPPICPSCGTCLTIKHIMTECRTYIESRLTSKLPEHLSESLGYNRSSLAATFEFIVKAKLVNRI